MRAITEASPVIRAERARSARGQAMTAAASVEAAQRQLLKAARHGDAIMVEAAARQLAVVVNIALFRRLVASAAGKLRRLAAQLR